MLCQSLEVATGKYSPDQLAVVDSTGESRPQTFSQYYSSERTMHWGAYGGSFVGSANVLWQLHALPRMVPVAAPTGALVAKKVFVDMTLGSLIFDSAACFLPPLMKGQSFVDAVENVKSRFFSVYSAELMMWTPFQFVNFYFVPLHCLPISCALFSVLWSGLLSRLINV